MQKAKFNVGSLRITPRVMWAVSLEELEAMVDRHSSGDWGDVTPDDAEANEAALVDGTRLFSVYRSASGATLWIITEADRSGTTVLLPEEY